MTNLTAKCLRCGRSFEQHKRTHLFCSRECRHRGELVPGERELADPVQVARLFDESRDPDELVGANEWHPSPDPEWRELDAEDTVRERRRWYERLLLEGLA